MGGSSQQPVTQQTQQTRDPWSAAQPHLIEGLENAQGLFQSNVGYQPYTGATQAGLDPAFNAGAGTMNFMLNQDLYGTPGVNAARSLGTNMINNQGLSPELRQLYQNAQGNENPFLQQMLESNNARIGNKINSSMSGAGRYGSGAHTDVMARGLEEAAAPVLAQDYARRQQQQQGILEGGLQRAGQWSELMPGLDQARYAPAQSLMNLGQFYNERSQSALDDQIKLYNAQQARPWEQLARYNAIVEERGFGGQHESARRPPRSTSPPPCSGCSVAPPPVPGWAPRLAGRRVPVSARLGVACCR